MKALLKYPLSLFILLLIGYSQLFTPLFREGCSFAPAKKITRKCLDVKTPDLQTIFIAEEEDDDDRVSFKKHAGFSSALPFPLLREWVFPVTPHHLALDRVIYHLALPLSPYLLFLNLRL